MTSQAGNARSHLRKRLRQAGRKDLLAEVGRGQLSVYAASVEAGHRQRPRPPETESASAKRRAFRRHPDRARKDLEMQLGPGSTSAFESTEEARQYWIANRDRLLEALARDGRRPMAWWAFESGGLEYPGRDSEQAVLFEAGELGPEEEAELLADWHHEFTRSHDPNFFVCLGPGRYLRGQDARTFHHAWAGIPRSLLEAWSQEGRRDKAAAEPVATSDPEEVLLADN